MFRILKSCLKSVVTETIGYEASVAEINYKFSSLDDIGVMISVRGYNDKILDFIKIYLETMTTYAESQSFEKNVLLNSMMKKKEAYSNSNLEADYRGHNNRDLYLRPHKFHDNVLAKILDEEIKALQKQEDGEKYTFDVGKFLKEKIIDRIISI